MNRLSRALVLLSAFACLVAVSAAGADVRPLPTELIGPEPLDPGTYQTRPAFVPRMTFTVGRGWSGGEGSHTGWCVGKGFKGLLGLDEGEGFFRVASICAFRTWLPYATAVSRFRALTTLTAGPSKPVEMGGYPGVSFHAVVPGVLAPTPGLPFASMLKYRPGGVRPGGEQIFLNVRGRTLLLQIEIFARKVGAEAARGVLRTMQFPL